MAITDKKTGVWGLDQVYNKINQGSIWDYSEVFELWSWGAGGQGDNGVNNRTDYSSPVQVPGNWVGLWSGKASPRNNIFAAKNANELWTWGSNSYGTLAHGPGSPGHRRSSPVQVGSAEWTNVEAGFYGGLGVKTNGGLFTWGYDSDGQLGLGPGGGNKSSPTQVGSDTTWSGSDYHISQGGYAAGALKTDGTLWMWGENQSGELGQSNKTKESSPKQVPGTTWSSISVGGGNAEGHTLATRTDGTAWAWGHNTNGTLGQGNTTQYSSPKQIPGTDWARVKTSAGRYSWGVKTDGTLWMWGSNGTGCLGQNDTTTYSSPRQIPGTTWDGEKVSAHGEAIAAVKTDGTLWVWGNAEEGWLGQNNQTTQYSSPVQVPGNWADVFVRNKGMAALRYI